MSLLMGYFDDSGRRDGPNPIAVVGGFVAHPREWLSFNPRWKRILDKYGIKMHRQTDWSGSWGEFKGWPEERHRAYMNELLGLVTSIDAVSVAAAIPDERFDSNYPKGRKYTSPFGYAASIMFSAAIELARKHAPDARIAYMFESGTEGLGEVEQTFNECLANLKVKEEFGLISFAQADKRHFMQLQAADVIAYEVFKLFEKGDDPDSLNVRYPLRTIGSRMPGIWTTPSVDMVQKSAELRDALDAVRAIETLRKRLGLS